MPWSHFSTDDTMNIMTKILDLLNSAYKELSPPNLFLINLKDMTDVQTKKAPQSLPKNPKSLHNTQFFFIDRYIHTFDTIKKRSNYFDLYIVIFNHDRLLFYRYNFLCVICHMQYVT